MTNALVTTEPLKQALALATEAGDMKALKEVHALASALRKGAQARGLGLEAENQAAEVVIRSERAMGQTIIALKDQGLLYGGKDQADTWRGLPTSEGAVKRREQRAKAGAQSRVAETHVRLEDLGVHPRDSSAYQRVAAMPEERFEELLDELRALGSRIAKVNFYASPRKAADVREYERSLDAEVPTNSAFEQFRAGAYALLEWEVAEEGTGAYALNTLMSLPQDDMREVAGLIRLLAEAYNKVRTAQTQ